MLCEFTRKNKSDTSVIVSMIWHEKMKTETHEVWISRDEIVDFLLYAASLEASVATRSKISRIMGQLTENGVLRGGKLHTIDEGVQD